MGYWNDSPTGTGVDAGGRVDTTETTASTTYVDLTTSGPAATVVVPPTGEVLVTLTATMDQSSATGYALMSVALSGANTVAASDTVSLVKLNTNFETKSGTYLFTGLTPGSTTFTAKYRADTAGTAEFSRRNIVVSVSGAAAGVVATDTVWDAAGDLVQGTGANTAARLALGTAGQVLTVNDGATAAAWVTKEIIKYKTADETVNNSTALQDDNHLTFPIAANEVWAVTCTLRAVAASATPDLKFAVSSPAGCTGWHAIVAPAPATTTAEGSLKNQSIGTLTTALTAGVPITGNSDAVFIYSAFVENSSTAGTITVQWAQNTATVADSTLSKGSFLRATRLV